jgi:hypothetical protein
MNPLETMITIDEHQVHLRAKAAEAVLDIPTGTPCILDGESGACSGTERGRCTGGEGLRAMKE